MREVCTHSWLSYVSMVKVLETIEAHAKLKAEEVCAFLNICFNVFILIILTNCVANRIILPQTISTWKHYIFSYSKC